MGRTAESSWRYMSYIRTNIPDGFELGRRNQNGKTLKELASEFTCNQQTIANRIMSVGYKIKLNRGPRLQLPPKAQLKKEYQNSSLRKMGEKYGVSYWTIANRLGMR